MALGRAEAVTMLPWFPNPKSRRRTRESQFKDRDIGYVGDLGLCTVYVLFMLCIEVIDSY